MESTHLPGTTKGIGFDVRTQRYLIEHSIARTDIHRRLAEATQAAFGEMARMQIPHEQGALLTLMTRLVGARTALEIGTFTGYSALCIAEGLPPDGKLTCLEINSEYVAVGRPFWKEAGVEDKIELRLGPALDSLEELPQEEFIDLVFMDADKTSQIGYYEQVLPRLRPGGVLLVDNVLQGGRVADPASEGETVQAVRRFNDHVAADLSVEVSMTAIADGLSLIRKRVLAA